MNTSLQESLQNLINQDNGSNIALQKLIQDYAKYHAVLVVVGGLFLVSLVLLSLFFVRKFKNSIKLEGNKWSYEKKIYVVFSLLTVFMSLVMALIVAANASSAIKPKQGFAGSISLLGSPAQSSGAYELQQSVNAWLFANTKLYLLLCKIK